MIFENYKYLINNKQENIYIRENINNITKDNLRIKLCSIINVIISIRIYHLEDFT